MENSMSKPSLLLASFFLLTPLALTARTAQVQPPRAQPAPPVQAPAPMPAQPVPPPAAAPPAAPPAAAPAIPAGPAASPRSIGDVQVMLDRVAYSPGVI